MFRTLFSVALLAVADAALVYAPSADHTNGKAMIAINDMTLKALDMSAADWEPIPKAVQAGSATPE